MSSLQRVVNYVLPDNPGAVLEFVPLDSILINTAGEILPKTTRTSTAHATTGVGSVTLPVPDDTGRRVFRYLVMLPDEEQGVFDLGYGPGAAELSLLLAVTMTPTPPPNILAALINEYSIPQVYLDWLAAAGTAVADGADLIPDAPSDGTQYVRKDHEWESVVAGGGDVDDLTTATGTATHMMRVATVPGGLEYRSPAQVLSDIGAEAAGAVATHAALETVHGLTGNYIDAMQAASSPATANPFLTATINVAQPSSADWSFMTIDPSDADALPFYWKLWTIPQGGGRANVGWNLGYNQSSGGGPQSNNDATLYLQMETHYLTVDPLFEFHLNAYTANGLLSTRPFHINVYKDDLYTQVSFYFDRLELYTRGASPIQLATVLSGATAALSQWTHLTPTVHRADGQSALSIRAADDTPRVAIGTNGGANGGYIKILGTSPTIDGDTGKYLNIINFAGVTLPGAGVIYANNVWDGAPSIDLTAGKVYKIGAVKVVGARVIDNRCDDAINSGDVTTDGVIDALRDAMIAHGLIAAA
jgi:hypothetical protein